MADENITEDNQNFQTLQKDYEDNISIEDISNSEEEVGSSDDEIDEILEEVDHRANRVKEHNLKLEERYKLLNNDLQILKSKLKDERELWKHEVEEVMKNGFLAAGDADVQINSNSNNLINDEYAQTSITSYNNYAKLQAERRAYIRRQVALNNYQRGLLEVESMCNMELLRVKQNFQYLQPLRSMVSDWNLRKEPRSVNEFVDDSKSDESKLDVLENQHNRSEKLSATIESLGTQIQNDINEMFMKFQQPYNSFSSEICPVNSDINASREFNWEYSEDFETLSTF